MRCTSVHVGLDNLDGFEVLADNHSDLVASAERNIVLARGCGLKGRYYFEQWP